jgi:hypothetical protein
LRESPSVPDHSASRNAVTAVIIFFAAHVALLVGVTTPEKFYFDEVHDVPAARQMLAPVMPAPMLNPMHPPVHSCRTGFRSFHRLQMERTVCAGDLYRHRRRDPLTQGWRIQFANGNADDW